MEMSDAQKIFLQKIAKRAYHGTVNDIQSLLEHGPTVPAPEELAIHEWYQNLSVQEQAWIQKICKKTAYSVMFGSLVLLDNLTGGRPIEGVLSDFALYLQTYQDLDAKSSDLPDQKIRINPSKSLLDLHDMINEYIDEPPE